jgi:type II secretion system protein H
MAAKVTTPIYTTNRVTPFGLSLTMQNVQAKYGMKQQGFTIAEVLLVALIIGLIAGSGTGLYVGTYQKLRVQRAAYDFFLTAQYARIMAIENACRYTLQMDTTGQAFLLSTLQENEDGEATEQIVKDPYCKPVQFEGNVVFEDVQLMLMDTNMDADTEDEEQQSVVFSPNGTAQAAVIQIGNGKTHYAISINAATGRAKIYFGTTENVKVISTDLDQES